MRPQYLQEVGLAAKALSQGKVILYPTDTIWGIGCSTAFPDNALRIYNIKRRPIDKSMILLVSDIEMLKKFVKTIHPRIENLLTHHERPLTVIYPEAQNLDPAFVASDGSIAIRICRDPFCNALIKEVNTPIVSTSANISGSPAPTHFREISSEIVEAVDYVVRYRQDDCKPTQPSVIIKYTTEGEIIVVRE